MSSSFSLTSLLNQPPFHSLLHLSTSSTTFPSVSPLPSRNAGRTRSPPPILCCSNSNPSVSSTAPAPVIAPPVLKKRKRYRKSYPGETKGITEEMRFVAMRLRNIKGIYPHKQKNPVSEDGESPDSDSDSDGDESEEEEQQAVVQQQEEEEEGKKVEEEGSEDGESVTWVPSMEGFVKYLVASKLVFTTVERILDTSDDISCEFIPSFRPSNFRFHYKGL
ncbi:Probable inactive heme oxygenase 2, chloroplastic [Linum grandiflorum]